MLNSYIHIANARPLITLANLIQAICSHNNSGYDYVVPIRVGKFVITTATFENHPLKLTKRLLRTKGIYQPSRRSNVESVDLPLLRRFRFSARFPLWPRHSESGASIIDFEDSIFAEC